MALTVSPKACGGADNVVKVAAGGVRT